MRTLSDLKTICGYFAVSSIWGPFMMSRHICGAASISNEAASMVVITLAADRFLGSKIQAESKRLKLVVYVEKPMGLARSTKLAWDLSSLYVPAGGAVTGAIAGAPADSVASENSLCSPSVATTSAAARWIRFPPVPRWTGGVWG